MSIAKAALKFFYEEAIPLRGSDTFLDYGDLEDMHRIVTIAGAKHCSFFTATQVTSRLANSSYWNKTFIPGFYSGMRGHGGANIFTPSEKGKEYYEKYIKE
ncbi:MAG: hypothetical protein ACOC1K_03915 [Nanoarchaeota archaeon]